MYDLIDVKLGSQPSDPASSLHGARSHSPSPPATISYLPEAQSFHSQKRPLPVLSESGSSDDASDYDGCLQSYPTRLGPRPGSSWGKQKALTKLAKLNSFEPNRAALEAFRSKILADDRYAEFKDKNLRAVRCSNCSKWVMMRALYDLRRWREHRDTVTCRSRCSKGTATKSICSFFPSQPPAFHLSIDKATITSDSLPCPGLSGDLHESIACYLARTSTPGGGAPPRKTIAYSLFPRLRSSSNSIPWSLLTTKQQKMVLRREELQYKWFNRRAVHAVFSGQPVYSPCLCRQLQMPPHPVRHA